MNGLKHTLSSKNTFLKREKNLRKKQVKEYAGASNDRIQRIMAR